MRKTVTREIDGLTFTVQQMPGTRGMRLGYELFSVLLPSIGKSLGGDAAFADVSQMFFDRMPGPAFEKLWKELLETTIVLDEKGERPLMPVLDDVMAGKFLTLLKLVTFALEVNFSDFLPQLAALKGQLAGGLMGKLSSVPNTSAQPGPAPV